MTNKKVEVKEPPRWRKKPGTGTHYMYDDVEAPEGKIFRAWPDELAGALDKFENLDDIDDEDQNNPVPKESTLIPVENEDGTWDVKSVEGVCINDNPLTKKEAESMVNGDVIPEVKEPSKSKAVITRKKIERIVKTENKDDKDKTNELN